MVDVVARLPDKLVRASQCWTDVVERLPLRLVRAAQCCPEAVSKAFRLNLVFADRSVAYAQ